MVLALWTSPAVFRLQGRGHTGTWKKKWAALDGWWEAQDLPVSLAQTQGLAGEPASLLSLCPSLPTLLGPNYSFGGYCGVMIADLGGRYRGTFWRWLSGGVLWVSEVLALGPES